ncbi:MAG: methyltransferase [Paracoccaceae bacterium]|nr:methyltransferase [Paracoccaceae bacterium]
MTSSRLSFAIDTGAVHLPVAGPIAVYRPPSGTDLSALPASRLRIAHGFAPDHAYWAALGHAVTVEPPEDAAGAVVVVPRAKPLARSLVAQALTHGGPVIVDGHKTDGIDSLLKDLRARVDVSGPVAKAHGKCAMISGPPQALADWLLPERTRTESGWITAPGAFSADGPDPGSVTLGRALPDKLSGRVADLGAGWGYLAFQALERRGLTEIALVEAEHAALEAARANIRDARAHFHWADATRWEGQAPFDHVICNPPFHASRQADPALGAAFIAAAARLLKPSGTLWLVANRHLPYEKALEGHFAELRPLGEEAGYKLVAASRPRSNRSRPRR